MAELTIAGVSKSYAGTRALERVDLTIEHAAFFTLLGPSGCGKTTLLRCIAGFLDPDEGSIHAAGRRIDTLPAHKRDIGMVFQDYAIFPHLTVAENVAFGLRARRLDRAEIGRRVADGLRAVRLEGFGDRLPGALSGGQQQRVGLARAMAIRPLLLLMDEPLSNLDAKLRVELRDEIRDIQQREGITTIYVTHDQEEALAVSDHICVMQAGRVEQVATPYDMYHHPQRRFAAAFVGTNNFLPAQVEEGWLQLSGQRCRAETSACGAVELSIRPEDVVIGEPLPNALVLDATVRKCTFLGREVHVVLDTAAGVLLHHAANPDAAMLGWTGRRVAASLPVGRIALFDAAGAHTHVTLLP